MKLRTFKDSISSLAIGGLFLYFIFLSFIAIGLEVGEILKLPALKEIAKMVIIVADFFNITKPFGGFKSFIIRRGVDSLKIIV